MLEEDIRETLKNKSGPELFRELLRHLPRASVDDYCRNGVWLENTLRLDIEIIAAHRLEAGAPDPIPLEKVKMPPLPPTRTSALVPGSVRPPAGVAQMIANAAAARAAVGGSVTVPPPKGASGVAAMAVQGLSPGTAEDLRQIALFVSKWRLDPSGTKALLIKLPAQRRAYVIQNFQTTVTTTAMSPVTKLEEYIAECEKSGAWDDASAKAALVKAPPVKAMPAVGTAPAVAGVPVVPGKSGTVPPPQVPGKSSGPPFGGAVVVPPAGVKRPLDQNGPGAGVVQVPLKKAMGGGGWQGGLGGMGGCGGGMAARPWAGGGCGGVRPPAGVTWSGNW